MTMARTPRTCIWTSFASVHTDIRGGRRNLTRDSRWTRSSRGQMLLMGIGVLGRGTKKPKRAEVLTWCWEEG